MLDPVSDISAIGVQYTMGRQFYKSMYEQSRLNGLFAADSRAVILMHAIFGAPAERHAGHQDLIETGYERREKKDISIGDELALEIIELLPTRDVRLDLHTVLESWKSKATCYVIAVFIVVETSDWDGKKAGSTTNGGVQMVVKEEGDSCASVP
ncbi:hypothetical protein B0H10DRAFT_1968467 [Mycena sp. CBHHK59/15]|nr:hypothetical protein B0H10DRAFT_1968467 [Mycena sp. CBHHK59/15]